MCRFVGPKAHNEWFAYPRAAPWTSYRWVASLQSLENHVCGTNIIKNTAKSCSINSKALHWFTGRMGKLIAFTALGITPTRTMAPLVLLVYWAKLSVFLRHGYLFPNPFYSIQIMFFKLLQGWAVRMEWYTNHVTPCVTRRASRFHWMQPVPRPVLKDVRAQAVTSLIRTGNV